MMKWWDAIIIHKLILTIKLNNDNIFYYFVTYTTPLCKNMYIGAMIVMSFLILIIRQVNPLYIIIA